MSNYSSRYSDEFKKDAIKLVKEDNRAVPSVAKDLGINPQTLRNWLNEQKHREKPENARISELEAELKAEKCRNAELEEALIKIIYLATIDLSKKWTQPLRIWKSCISQFAIYFDDRLKSELTL